MIIAGDISRAKEIIRREEAALRTIVSERYIARDANHNAALGKIAKRMAAHLR